MIFNQATGDFLFCLKLCYTYPRRVVRDSSSDLQIVINVSNPEISKTSCT